MAGFSCRLRTYLEDDLGGDAVRHQLVETFAGFVKPTRYRFEVCSSKPSKQIYRCGLCWAAIIRAVSRRYTIQSGSSIS